ncbi:hypothetical protein GBA52_026396 [Prunus armeniaca]|nr:hypothetical protein GBA52_026396 [Prunus armeniaca]
MRIPAAFSTCDQCPQEQDCSVSYKVQAASCRNDFFMRLGQLPKSLWNIRSRQSYEGKSGMKTGSLKRGDEKVLEKLKG